MGGGRLLSGVPDEAGVVGESSADVWGSPAGTWIAGNSSGCMGELAGPSVGGAPPAL